MILGQLRMGARKTKNAPLSVNKTQVCFPLHIDLIWLFLEVSEFNELDQAARAAVMRSLNELTRFYPDLEPSIQTFILHEIQSAELFREWSFWQLYSKMVQYPPFKIEINFGSIWTKKPSFCGLVELFDPLSDFEQ